MSLELRMQWLSHSHSNCFTMPTKIFSRIIPSTPQVAPFLKSTTHSMFQEQSQDYNQSSSDDDDNDDFDMENIGRRKRKKERKVRCILPANMRLGDVLMVVQIRAKPSALPLPTLSKVRSRIVVACLGTFHWQHLI